jgi:hypothetical protein
MRAYRGFTVPAYVKPVAIIVTSLIGYILFVLLLLYIVLLGASHVYVTGNSSIGDFALWELYGHVASFKLPGLTEYGRIRVETVDASHAVRNLLFLVSTAALSALIPVAIFLFGIAAGFSGLFTADWERFLWGFLIGIIGAPVSAAIAVLFSVMSWVSLIFQTSTPGYTLILILAGIPILALGASGGASPTVIVLVFLRK